MLRGSVLEPSIALAVLSDAANSGLLATRTALARRAVGIAKPIAAVFHPLDARGLERSAAAVEAEAGNFEARIAPNCVLPSVFVPSEGIWQFFIRRDFSPRLLIRGFFSAAVLAVSDREPASLTVRRAIWIELLHRNRHRHQCRNISPKVKASEVPTRPTDPWDRAAHVLDDQRDMPPSRLTRLALNAEAGVEQRQLLLQQVRVGADFAANSFARDQGMAV